MCVVEGLAGDLLSVCWSSGLLQLIRLEGEEVAFQEEVDLLRVGSEEEDQVPVSVDTAWVSLVGGSVRVCFHGWISCPFPTPPCSPISRSVPACCDDSFPLHCCGNWTRILGCLDVHVSRPPVSSSLLGGGWRVGALSVLSFQGGQTHLVCLPRFSVRFP